MGRGYYNKATGRRLLKTKPTTVPFGGCVVEVIETDIFENTPLATVRVYQANNYYEGIVYREDHDLEDYSESK